jgi:hypothetical protein
MCLKNIAFSVFLLCAFAAMAISQNQNIEHGSAGELKDVEKVFLDVRADTRVRDNIIKEIRKKLRAVKRDLEIVSKPEDSDIHLRFHYEMRTVYTGPARRVVKTPFGKVVKILGQDRERVLMSYSDDQPSYMGTVVWGTRNHEIEFAREFAKAYLGANSQKLGQPVRLLSRW